jgi:hypothetical protein
MNDMTKEMNDTTKDWKPDPTLGGEHIEARRAEVVAHLKLAVSVGHYHVDQQLALDIEALKKKAGDQKGKLTAAVKTAQTQPAMTVVRKYWQKDQAEVLHHLTETIMRG